MPTNAKDLTVKFKNFKNKLKVPFVIYADFEAINDEKKSPKDVIYYEQKVSAYSMLLVSEYPSMITQLQEMIKPQACKISQ